MVLPRPLVLLNLPLEFVLIVDEVGCLSFVHVIDDKHLDKLHSVIDLTKEIISLLSQHRPKIPEHL